MNVQTNKDMLGKRNICVILNIFTPSVIPNVNKATIVPINKTTPKTPITPPEDGERDIHIIDKINIGKVKKEYSSRKK